MARDRDREQHIALARTRARNQGANVHVSTKNAEIDYERAMKTQRKKDRRTRRLDDLLEEPSHEGFLQAMIDLDHAKTMANRYLSDLSKEHSAVIRMHLFQGMTFVEIGEQLGVSTSWANERYWSAIFSILNRIGGRPTEK